MRVTGGSLYMRLATGNRWHFGGPDGPIAVTVRRRFRADNSEAVREAVIAGAGIAVIPCGYLPMKSCPAACGSF